MKTIELKWIEDDSHVVAEDAYTGMKELIETGVFPNLKVECKDDTLYITGKQDDLDKAVMKIQKDYVKYGQIMIKEAHKQAEGVRIESFNKDIQEIFDYTLNEYNTFKESTKSTDYITRLGDFHVKFNRLKDAAKGKDKKIIQNYIDEIVDLTESIEDKKIKPIMNKMTKKICEAAEKKVINPETIGTIDVVVEELQNLGYGPFVSKALVKDHRQFVIEMLNAGSNPFSIAKALDKQYMNEDANNDVRKHLSNPRNWGIVEESLTIQEYNDKYDEVALLYAKETGMDLDDAYDELMDKKDLARLVDSDLEVREIVDKLMPDFTKLTESMLSPSELKKKLTRVAEKWASKTGVTYEEAYDELRMKKSVKDMLDFYTVDEIIESLMKKKKDLTKYYMEDDLDESLSTKKYYSKYTLLKKAKKLNASEIVDYDEYKAIKSTQLMNEIGYSMDINGNKSAALWIGDRDGKYYFATNPGLLIRT